MPGLVNSSQRHAFISQHLASIGLAPTDLASGLRQLQSAIEAATSLRFESRDRAALRLCIRRLFHRLKTGEIDEPTAYAGMNRLIMAVSSNNPDFINIIYAGV